VTAKTGFTIDTLRYYERVGLLHDVGRTPGGRRVFTDQDVAFLGLLRCLRDTDMPIAEMLKYVDLLRGGQSTVDDRVALLRDHEHRVAERIERLLGHQAQIRHKIEFYSGTAVPA
jgi:DNA-binding transcriptional MerR regulator